MAKYPEHLSQELLASVEAVVNGTVTAEQMQLLEQTLAESSAARSLLLDYIDLHVVLKRKFLRPLEEEPTLLADWAGQLRPATQQTVTPASQHEPTGRHAWLPTALAVAAGLLLIVGGSLVVTKPVVTKPDTSKPGSVAAIDESAVEIAAAAVIEQLDEVQHASLHGLAVLSHAVDVEWSEGSDRPSVGSPVPLGNLSIESGVLQLEFYCGAVAVLEGPASFDLLATDLGHLHSGKIRARVPPQAKGFTIVTPAGEVVDLGTEFALAIGRDQPTELHVLDGEVRFHSAHAQESDQPRHVLGGQGLRFGTAIADTAEISASGEGFVGPTELEAYSREQATSRYRDWQQHRQRLLQDPSLVAYYAHSPEPRWSRTLRNLKPNAGDDTHGAIVGCDWVSGRWPGHRALKFRNASHRVSINLPGEFDSLTLSTWLSVNQLHPSNNVALMHPEIEQPRVVHWTLDRLIGVDAAVLHFSETDNPVSLENRVHYNSVAHALDTSDLDRWVHLALVYDAERMEVSHYRDGQLLGSKPIDQARKLGIGVANLGNWPYKDWAKGTEFETRNLNGRMDEFMILGRPLAATEIAGIYEAGRK